MSNDEEFEETPEFLTGLAEKLDARPHLIVTRITGAYTPRKFKRAVKRLCKHFGIPANLTSLIAVTSLHDYELAIFDQYLFLFRIDTDFAEVVAYEPAMLHATLTMEDDTRIVQFV
jgi:hypothetical protein